MEQLQEAPAQETPLTQHQSPETPATETKPAARPHPGLARCSHRTGKKGRCRLPVQDPAIGLCFRHAALARQGALDDSLDLSKEIFAKQEGAYDSPETINSLLSNIIELVAQGRLSPRRAAVMTYAFSLMLRGSVVYERQVSNQLPLNYVPRRPLDDEPFTPPTTPEEAIAAYERLRS